MKVMSWTKFMYVSIIQRLFDSTAIHLFRLAVTCQDEEKAEYALTNGEMQRIVRFRYVCVRECDLHLDLWNGSRLNVNITNLQPTCDFLFCGISNISPVFYRLRNIHSRNVHYAWHWPLEWIKVKYKYANRKPIFD